jgi:UDP-N-acetylglucosamine acyltransferase
MHYCKFFALVFRVGRGLFHFPGGFCGYNPPVIHPTAVVSPKAELGADVEIGPYCVINDNVILGDRCRLNAHVVIDGYSAIGADNVFYPFTSIGQRSQDLKYDGEPTRVEIGDRNVFREYVTVHRGTHEAPSVIGSNNHFLAYAHCAHDSIVGDHCILSNGATLGGHVTVEDHVIISGLSGVHQFCRLGAHSIIGGCTKIVKDVPPFMIADGNPAALRGLNLVGMQRRGFSPETIRTLKNAYKALFMKKEANLAAQVEAFRDNPAAELPEVRQLLDFLGNSERGIVR